jgi:hypothetical protein
MAEKMDDVLVKRPGISAQPKQKVRRKASDGRGAAKGLTLDNMEAMADGLRIASEPTRRAVKVRNAASYKRTQEERAKAGFKCLKKQK